MPFPQKTRPAAWIAGIVITTAWLAMMGSLVRGYLFKHTISPPDANPFQSVTPSANWRETEEYMKLVDNGQSIGAARLSFKHNPDTKGWRSDFILDAKLGKSLLSSTITLSAAADLDSQFHLSRFHADADIVLTEMALSGLVTRDNTLLLELTRGRSTRRYSVALKHPLSMAFYLSPGLAGQMAIQAGSHASIPIFDPFGETAQGILDVRVIKREPIIMDGHTREAYRVESTFHDIKTTMWVDALGAPLKRELPGGITLERTTSATAISIAPDITRSPDIPRLNPDSFPKTTAESTPPTGLSLPFSLGW